MGKEKVNKGRRRFLKLGTLAGAGLVLGVYCYTGGEKTKTAVEIWDGRPKAFTPNAWVRIGTDDSVTVMVNHTELGQGILTALSMIVAEELGADWTTVRAEIAPAESVYKNPEFKMQMTGGSTSVKTSWEILRRAGAVAREMLMTAAARTWSVPLSECRVDSGTVVHISTGRRLRFGELAEKASRLPPPDKVQLKDPGEFNLVGTRKPRLDTPAKIRGRAVYGMDVKLPGLLTATVIHPPALGAKLKFIDPAKTETLPGMRRILEIEGGVAVVADSFWQARQGARALKIEWDYESGEGLDSRRLSEHWAGLAKGEGKIIHETGQVEEAMSRASSKLTAVYELPYQAHATPEPMNCTAHVHKDGCDVWVPTQSQDAAQEAAARETGLRYNDVRVHTTFAGGGFGRRIATDYVVEAVQLSKTLEAPVKVIWTREEDMRHDYYRPASYNVLAAGLDDRGMPLAWSHRIVGPDHMAQMIPRMVSSMIPYPVPRLFRNAAAWAVGIVAPRVVPGKKAAEGAVPLPYAIENVRLDYVKDDPGVPIGFWRSVAHSQNAFVVESFLDELAAAAGRDPYEYRLKLLDGRPRLLNVLKLAAEKSEWGRPLEDGVYRGIAAHEFHHTLLSCVVEASVGKKGRVKVHRVICAVDCGIVINPKIVEAQIRGGIVFGLTATLKSAVSIKKGRVQQGNFDDFPLLRMDEMPQIDVYIVPSTEPPTGIGESAVPMIAPAVTNAVYAATGKRVRKIPIDPGELVRSV